MTEQNDATLAREIDALNKMTVTDIETGEILSLRQYVRRLSAEPLAAEIKALEQIIMIDDDTGELLPFKDYIQRKGGECNFVQMDEAFNGQRPLKIKPRVRE